MDTINIHWGFAFVLPLIGAFVARRYYIRWQAWVAASAMSLISFLMIRFIGHGTNEYAFGVLAGTTLIGAMLPEICRGVSASVQLWLSRPRNVFILVGVIAIAWIFSSGNEGWLIKAGMLAALGACMFFSLRSILSGFVGGKKERRR